VPLIAARLPSVARTGFLSGFAPSELVKEMRCGTRAQGQKGLPPVDITVHS